MSGIIYCQSNTNSNLNFENAAQWFNSGKWENGMSLKAYKGIDIVEFDKQYHKNELYWKKAFEFLKNTNLDTLSPGKYKLMGDTVFVSVTNNATKSFEETQYEAHKKYIDLQYVYQGKEKMGMAALTNATVKVEFSDKKDIGYYNIPEKDCKYYIAQPDTFMLFFPSQAHRPNIKIEGCDKDKKLVVKIMAN